MPEINLQDEKIPQEDYVSLLRTLDFLIVEGARLRLPFFTYLIKMCAQELGENLHRVEPPFEGKHDIGWKDERKMN